MIISKKRKLWPFFLALAGLIAVLHYSGLTRPLENFFIFAAQPLTQKFYKSGVALNRSYEESQDKDSDPAARIKELEDEVASLTVVKADYQEMADENAKLKEMIDFADDSGYRLVAASVIAKENADKDNRDLVINRGSKDGLSEGVAVVDEHGVLVGKVVETKDSISKICLSINPECSFAASIQNQAKTQGLVAGDLGLTVKMSYIPQLEKISVGDIVVTSGLGGQVPRGLVIGKISEVKSETNEVWQEATIDPPVDFDNLTIVSAVLP